MEGSGLRWRLGDVWFGRMRLQQGQVWRVGEEFVRIVELHRLEVKYKAMRDLSTREGTHHHVTKKQFCRLIKGGALVEEGVESGLNDK